jgi:hypothetical protein
MPKNNEEKPLHMGDPIATSSFLLTRLLPSELEGLTDFALSLVSRKHGLRRVRKILI